VNFKLVASSRSRFFRGRPHFSDRTKLRSTNHRFGITAQLCSSLHLAICIYAQYFTDCQCERPVHVITVNQNTSSLRKTWPPARHFCKQ
jgi:hypothetical protein